MTNEKPVMRALTDRRTIIGECPIWNGREQKLYLTNAIEREILVCDIDSRTVIVRKTPMPCAALCFSAENELIVSYDGGVAILDEKDAIIPIYDMDRYHVLHANDMKVGPDGRIYVGTQSEQRLGISNEIDGKLYVIDAAGQVRELLGGLRLSNGLDWSPSGRLFYHTDSDTGLIREYDFCTALGTITPTGREVRVAGVDGLCVAEDGTIYAAVWGGGHVAVIDAAAFRIKSTIPVPTGIPVSCGFAGADMDVLVVTTARFGAKETDPNAGVTFLCEAGAHGKPPYTFGNAQKRGGSA